MEHENNSYLIGIFLIIVSMALLFSPGPLTEPLFKIDTSQINVSQKSIIQKNIAQKSQVVPTLIPVDEYYYEKKLLKKYLQIILDML